LHLSQDCVIYNIYIYIYTNLVPRGLIEKVHKKFRQRVCDSFKSSYEQTDWDSYWWKHAVLPKYDRVLDSDKVNNNVSQLLCLRNPFSNRHS
jgi:hypothetical protein